MHHLRLPKAVVLPGYPPFSTAGGAGKIMWGSNYPGILTRCTYPQTLDLVRASRLLSEDEKAKILGGAAAGFFRRAGRLDGS